MHPVEFPKALVNALEDRPSDQQLNVGLNGPGTATFGGYIDIPARRITVANVQEFWDDLKQKTGKQ